MTAAPAPNYNPDVLSCLANLSNDEVFTPPGVVNDMLDMLPASLWHNPQARFLDPACKSGVFLREIAKRLMAGLETHFPDVQTRANHIFTQQLFGIAITELTALVSRRTLYCAKRANSQFSICTAFEGNPAGNIRYAYPQHTWGRDGKCTHCRASQEVYARGPEAETHAYEFIHTPEPHNLFPNMQFDVIIGNPPYQLSDSGHGRSASPVYHLFVEQAKKLNPRYLIMITPSRWFAGGKGLDKFREEMRNDKRLKCIVDFLHSSDVFPGVDVAGGISYFLWDRDHNGKCEFVNSNKSETFRSLRFLNEFPIIIRDSKAIDVIKKVEQSNMNGVWLNDKVLPSKPFGMRTFYEPKQSGIPCWFIQKIGLAFANPDDVSDEHKILDKWKFLLPKAPIAGQTDFSKPIRFYYDGNTRIAEPGHSCTESWIVAGAFDTFEQVDSYKSYIMTKVVRFLLLQTVVSQDVTRDNFKLIPDIQQYDRHFTDEYLCKLWGITEEEWAMIDAKIVS